MAKKTTRSLTRRGKIDTRQAQRDRVLRRKVKAEFPPLSKASLSGLLSECLKRAIRDSEKTPYQIAKEAGLSPIVVSRFLSGERDIRLATADKLGKVLGLRLTGS